MKKRYIGILVAALILSIIFVTNYINSISYSEVTIESDHIAYLSNRGDKLELYMTDKEGKHETKMIEANNDIFHYSISPDNSKLLLAKNEVNVDQFGGYDSKRLGLYLYDVEEKSVSLVDEDGEFPLWAPDGDKFAFSVRTIREGERHLYIAILDSKLDNIKKLKQQYKKHGIGAIPAESWHPNESEFIYFADGGAYRYLVNEDKIKKLPLEKEVKLRAIDWSPKGDKLAAIIHYEETGKEELVFIDPENGSFSHQYVLDKPSFGTLNWSPDGKYLLFDLTVQIQKDRFGRSRTYPKTWPAELSEDNIDVFIYDIENREVKNITNSDHADFRPYWIP